MSQVTTAIGHIRHRVLGATTSGSITTFEAIGRRCRVRVCHPIACKQGFRKPAQRAGRKKEKFAINVWHTTGVTPKLCEIRNILKTKFDQSCYI
jgi:hypothetical protein